MLAQETLCKLPFGQFQAQQLTRREDFFELVVILQFDFSFLLFLGKYSLRGCLELGIGGIYIVDGLFFEVAGLVGHLLQLVVHRVVYGKEITSLFAAEFQLLGKELMLIGP